MRHALLPTALLLLPLCLAFADEPKKDEKKAALLNGKWSVVKFEVDGQAAEVGESSLTFKDGKYSVWMGGQEAETGTVTVSADKTPAQLDFDIKTGNDKGKKQLGLFKVDGDKLVVCLAMPGAEKRPAKIESGEGIVYAELKKAKQ